MLNEQGLGAGYKDNDGFDSSGAGQRKIDEQDAATKINPEHGLLDIADFCALARLMRGWGLMHLHGILVSFPADTSVLNECIVVPMSQGRIADVLHSNSAWYAGRE